jgi:tetratricopeptide (TPR) repeat protein
LILPAAAARPEIKLNPQTPLQEQAFDCLVQGTQMLKAKKPFQAKKPLQKAAQLWPQSAPIHYNLGFCYHDCGEYSAAVKEFQAAFQLDPEMSDCIINIANCFQMQGKAKEAVGWFELYLKQKPAGTETQEIRGMIRSLRRYQLEQVETDPQSSDYFEAVTENWKPRRWPLNKLPLKVYISNGRAEDGHFVQGFREEFNVLLLESLNAWMKATVNRLSYRLVTDASQADIWCTWTNDPAFLHEAGNKVEQGAAHITSSLLPDGTRLIQSVHVVILVLARETKKPLTTDEMRMTCLHELGHALGLAGHSTNNRDVMFFSEAPSVWPALTKRDKQTLFRIYQDYPQRVPGF